MQDDQDEDDAQLGRHGAKLDGPRRECEASRALSYVLCLSCARTTLPTLRGGAAFCSACGAPVATQALLPPGEPAKVGGKVAGVLGWAMMAFGLLLALAVGTTLSAGFDAGALTGILWGALLGLPLMAWGYLLHLGGRKLRRSGERSSEEARLKVLWGLASQRQGRVTALEAARALGCSSEAADQSLTELARKGDIRMDVDDEGTIYYLFGQAQLPPRPRARIEVPEGMAPEETEEGSSAASRRRAEH